MQEDRQINRIFIYKKDKMMIQSGKRGNLMLVCFSQHAAGTKMCFEHYQSHLDTEVALGCSNEMLNDLWNERAEDSRPAALPLVCGCQRE